MLAMDRKVVMGKRLRRTKSIVPGAGSNSESLRTNKVRLEPLPMLFTPFLSFCF